MSAFRALAILFVFLLFITVVHAREGIPVTGKATAVGSVPANVSEIVPLSVHASKDMTLRVIAATHLSTENVLNRERAAYASIRSRWVNGSSAERSALQPEMTEQRRRLLLATLNRITAIYQRIDMIISTMDTTLIRLRSIHSARGTSISYFDSRHNALQTQLSALHVQSDTIAAEIAECQKGIQLSNCVQSSRNHTAELLSSLKDFFSSYRALALDVVQ